MDIFNLMSNILLNQYKINNDIEYDFNLLSQRINSSYNLLKLYIPNKIKIIPNLKLSNCNLLGFTIDGKIITLNNKKEKTIQFNNLQIGDRLIVYNILKDRVINKLKDKCHIK